MKRLLPLATAIALLAFTPFFSGCSSKKVYKPHKTKYTSKARQKSTMRSYRVRGKRYKPTYVSVGQVMKGISSWYGPNFHGKKTSNGERYNMHARTAAHKTWPMDTMVKVTNLQNGKSTTVRINDRGPFVRGRIIDCSYTAGKELGLDRMGIAKVSIKVVGFAGKVQSSSAIAKHQKSNTQTRIKLSNFGVQVGAFKRYEGAKITKKMFAKMYGKYKPVIKKFYNVDGSGEALYRVWLMGFGSEDEARDFKNSNDLEGAFIVRN
jgi:rare lipoprotein A